MSEEWEDDANGWDDDDDDGEEDDWGEFEDNADDDEAAAEEADAVWVQIDNLFYEADDSRRKHPEQALEQFERCVELEKSTGTRISKRFKALEHIVSIQISLGRFDDVIVRYRELLALTADPQVTSNERAHAINAILNAVTDTHNSSLIEEVYRITLEQLRSLGNQERIYFSVSMKLCRTYLDSNQFERVSQMLADLHRLCVQKDGTDDPSKGSELLEVYAVEIQLLAAQGDSVKLKELFRRTKNLSAEINDPRSMSVIQECWAKSFASEARWEEAYTEFWGAFLQFQQIGHDRAKVCLKYVIFTNMLSSRPSNPFDATEARVYLCDPDIEELAALQDAYEKRDIQRFQQLLAGQKLAIHADPFLQRILSPLLREMRSQALLQLIKPYRRMRLQSMADKLDATVDEVEQLLMELILDETVQARVDQVKGIVDLSVASSSLQRHQALRKWSDALCRVSDALGSSAGRIEASS